METLNWIMSEGGPLIMMEKDFQTLWGGIFRLTDTQSSAKSDYDRLNKKLDFIESVNISGEEALVFGEGPLDTAFWSSQYGKKFIIRTIYCESEFDANALMLSLDEDVFENPCEIIEFDFRSSNLIIFDSAEDGAMPDVHTVAASIDPGRYQILTKLHEPDEFTSLVLHRFDKIK